jgi:hypothetical protein
LTLDKDFMHDAMKRVNELKQETIDKSKKIPNSETIVKERLASLYSTDGFVLKRQQRSHTNL